MASVTADESTEPAPPPAPSASEPEPNASDVQSTQPDAPNSAPPLDPLTQLSSMWSGWMSTSTDTNPGRAAADWLQGAGKMVENAVKDVGTKISEASQSIDSAAVGEQVNVIRQRSGQFVEDVSRSVQNINLNLDQEEFQKRAQVISSSTRDLIDKASQSLQQGRQEALEIFVDESPETTTHHSHVAPWDINALPEGERSHADALRQEMLKIVVDAIYSKKKRNELFLSNVAEKNNFSFDLVKNEGTARAVLDTDKNMRRLRAGLVPGKMNEDAFWRVYFYHLQRIRQTLLANEGKMPPQQPDEEYDDPAALFGDDDEDEELAAIDTPPKVRASVETTETDNMAKPDGDRNWDDEIDAIFDENDDENGTN